MAVINEFVMLHVSRLGSSGALKFRGISSREMNFEKDIPPSEIYDIEWFNSINTRVSVPISK
jgi:hypothetical protein